MKPSSPRTPAPSVKRGSRARDRAEDRRTYERPRETSLLTAGQWVLFLVLIALPGAALVKLTQIVDWRLLAGVGAVMQLFAFTSVWRDKSRARRGVWRLPETMLHTFEALGGWPAAFLAQRLFRHKTSKGSFQSVTWLIILAYQIVALDYVLDWWIIQTVKALLVRAF